MFCRLFLVAMLAAGIPIAPALQYDDAALVLGTPAVVLAGSMPKQVAHARAERRAAERAVALGR